MHLPLNWMTGGQSLLLFYNGNVKSSTILVFFNDGDAAMTCTRVSDVDAFKCLTQPPASGQVGNMTITLFVGVAKPIILPWTYQYLTWQQWSPRIAMPPDVPFTANDLRGLPSDGTAKATRTSNTIIISVSVTFAIIVILWFVLRWLCPHRCKTIKFLDAFDTTLLVMDPRVNAFHHAYQQTNLGAFATIATIMVWSNIQSCLPPCDDCVD
jgi:hypothetical protein